MVIVAIAICFVSHLRFTFRCTGVFSHLAFILNYRVKPPIMSDPSSLIQQAEKLTKPQLGFFLMFSGSSLSYRLEEATDLYVQAANQYRLKKDFERAGQQFVKAADLQKSLSNHNDVANHLIEAYKCYKGVNVQGAIEALSQAIHIFLTQNGQFRRAANFTLDLGELYELNGDVPNAISSYEKAGDYFDTDHAEALSNKAYLQCADLSALQGDYKRAVELYEKIIKNSLGNNLTKWNLKDYFLKTLLCVLCQDDLIEAQKKCENFSTEEPTWSTTREYKLIQDIFDAMDQGDVQAFSDRVFEYDQFSKLDKLKTQLLLKIKGLVDKDDDEMDLL